MQLTNPTPCYINLIQVSVNGKAFSDAGFCHLKASVSKLVSGNRTVSCRLAGDK
ncbi:hypothetical protein ACLK17_05985 [Escherichia coli]